LFQNGQIGYQNSRNFMLILIMSKKACKSITQKSYGQKTTFSGDLTKNISFSGRNFFGGPFYYGLLDIFGISAKFLTF